ncbi:MAG: AAA family ATPase [bacterium]|nr:AAA family ATPase [bacterium]
MFLSKFVIINYRSCRDIVLNFDSDVPNVFIGHTDAGKSTILKSIGLFLDEKPIPPCLIKEDHETSDISNTQISKVRYKAIFDELKVPYFDPGEHSIILIGVFKKQDDDFGKEFDDMDSKHLKWSIESHSEDEITIIKQFNSQYPTGRYLIASLEDENRSELWKQPQKTLDDLIKKLNLTKEDINNDNGKGKYKNVEKFRAIYSKIKTSLQWSEYSDFLKGDRELFPIFRYIDKIDPDNIKNMATDAMSSIINEFETKMKLESEKLGREATNKVNEELNKKIGQIVSDIPFVKEIKAKVFFKSSQTISEISVNKNNSDGSVNLDAQGDGIKKQIGFVFMKFAAIQEGDDLKSKKFLWGFDEPETHLYPPEKRDFYETIKKLSTERFQTFISTHSTTFVDKSKIKSIRRVDLCDGYSTIAYCSSVVDIHESLGIKNSDFLFYDIFFAGEGDSEQTLIPHFYKLYFGRSLEDDSIQFINLGGETNWKKNKDLFEQFLNDFKDPNDCVYYLLDRDTNLVEPNAFLVGQYDLEDSIDNKFWMNLVNEKCDIKLDNNDLDTIRKSLGSDQNHKFHKLLGNKIIELSKDQKRLLSKSDCAKYMKEHILDKKDIPNDIVKLFKEVEKK